MSLVASNWSVVVLGHWNRAILTPSGIGTRLFGLPPGTPLDVDLAIDAIAPPRVNHDGLVVFATGERLVVRPSVCNYASLQRCRDIATTALRSLPETPVRAVGVNINFESTELIPQLADLLEGELDAGLSRSGFEISERSVTRSLAWNSGAINIAVHDTPAYRVSINFERSSESRDEQITWLQVNLAEIRSKVDLIFNEVIGCEWTVPNEQ